jgi:hypothetical protein
MYAENNTIFIKKSLPKTFAEFSEFYEANIKGRACAWHMRMRTHGLIDLTNCHPYEVISQDEGYPLWLMHNGVLHTGNELDATKSDTWHYINDYLRPMLLKNPEWFTSPQFNEMVGEHIGSNRFALLDAYGNMTVVNKEQGIEHNGAWLSNTYAWDTAGTKHEKPQHGGYGAYRGPNVWGKRSGFSLDDFDYEYDAPLSNASNKRTLSLNGYERDDAPLSTAGNSDERAGLELLDEWRDAVLEAMCNDEEFDNVIAQVDDDMLDDYYSRLGDARAWWLVDDIANGYVDAVTALDCIQKGKLTPQESSSLAAA